MDLYFGYSDTTIFPRVPIGLAGYAHRHRQGFVNSGVKDLIYARSISLKCGGEELIIVTLDLCMLNHKSSDAIRQSISQKTGVPLKNIMLSAIHTHSGPDAFPRDERYKASKREKEYIQEYLAELEDKVVAICSEAQSRSHKSKLYTATLDIRLGYNRRFNMRDDNGNINTKMLFNRWKHPLHSPDGTVDNEVPILMLERADDGSEDFYLNQNGYDRVILFSAPYHPVVMGDSHRYISADYPGAARKCIEDLLGDGTKAVFLLGACGDTHPMLACQRNYKAVEIIGNALGNSAVAVLAGRTPLKVDSIAGIEDSIRPGDKTYGKIGTQVFKIGEAGIAAISAECFTRLGIKIRNNSCFKQTLISTVTNGYSGYLPTREAFSETGYEIDIAKNIGYTPGILETVIENVIQSCRKLNTVGED